MVPAKQRAFYRTTAKTFEIFCRQAETLRQLLQPFGLFRGPDIDQAGWTKQPAHGRYPDIAVYLASDIYLPL